MSYTYEGVGDRYIAPHTRVQVHRVFHTETPAVTVAECFDFDNLMRVINALNGTTGEPMKLFVDDGMGDVVA